jgi:hypothetical protein
VKQPLSGKQTGGEVSAAALLASGQAMIRRCANGQTIAAPDCAVIGPQCGGGGHSGWQVVARQVVS